ncbi:MAG: hypothetical protein Q9191_003599 [Dirinaria sp. TL-2023a]
MFEPRTGNIDHEYLAVLDNDRDGLVNSSRLPANLAPIVPGRSTRRVVALIKKLVPLRL